MQQASCRQLVFYPLKRCLYTCSSVGIWSISTDSSVALGKIRYFFSWKTGGSQPGHKCGLRLCFLTQASSLLAAHVMLIAGRVSISGSQAGRWRSMETRKISEWDAPPVSCLRTLLQSRWLLLVFDDFYS